MACVKNIYYSNKVNDENLIKLNETAIFKKFEFINENRGSAEIITQIFYLFDQ